MLQGHKDYFIALLLPLVVITQARTCSETDGYIACNTALCYFQEFDSCGVICTEGCSFSVFTDSLVECLGGYGCSNASFQRSRVSCQACASATFYFSAVTCDTREACNDVDWASGNCCDGIGCPSTVPSCEGDVAELCSTKVLGFAVSDGGNPVCTELEQRATAEPTKSPVLPPTGALNPVPQTIPTQKPSLSPVAAPIAAPVSTFQVVQDTETGIYILLRGVETPEANDILSFESTVGAWFEEYYSAGGGESGIEEMNTIITVTSHHTTSNTALTSTELTFKQQVRYMSRSQLPLDLDEVVADPFWDDLANADLVDRLRLAGGSFAALLGPIGVPEFVGVDNQQVDASGNSTPDEKSSNEQSGMNSGAPVGVYVALVVLGAAVVVLLMIGLVVFCLRNRRGKTKTNVGATSAIERENERGASHSGSTLENTDPSSSEAQSGYSRTFATSTASSRTDTTVTPHANVVGVQPVSNNLLPELTYKCQTSRHARSTQGPQIATAEAIPVGSLQP